MNRRLAAITSLVLLAASVVLAVVLGVQSFPRGLTVLACLVAALLAAWWALVHRGAARFAAAAGAVVLLVGAVVLVVLEGRVLEDALVLAGLVLWVAAARGVFTVHAKLPTAPAPKRAVLFYNPKSGGGKAERFEVAREARTRGVEPVELHLGDDLATLVRNAIANGADAVGVAGGDGTQAIVAAIASERGLPYVCVPAGTRNHFALERHVVHEHAPVDLGEIHALTIVASRRAHRRLDVAVALRHAGHRNDRAPRDRPLISRWSLRPQVRPQRLDGSTDHSDLASASCPAG